LSNNYFKSKQEIKIVQAAIKKVTESRKKEVKNILTAAAKKVYFG